MHSAAYAMHGEGPMELDVAARCWDVDILFWVEWVLVLLPDVDGDGLPCWQGFPTFNACPGGRRPLHLIAADNADDDGDDGLSDLSDDDNARPRPANDDRGDGGGGGEEDEEDDDLPPPPTSSRGDICEHGKQRYHCKECGGSEGIIAW